MARPQRKPPRARLVEAKRELYRTALLDAAERVFADQGYEAKVREVVEAAGLSLATFYTVFDSKEDLLREIHRRRLNELMAQIMGTVPPDADPFERLRAGIEGYLLFHMERPNYLRMHLRDGAAWATAENFATPEQADAWNAGLQMLTAAFKEGIDTGLFFADDPELLARTAVAMHQVRLVLWVKRGMKEDPRQVAADASRQLLRLCVRDAEPTPLSSAATKRRKKGNRP